MSQNTHPSRTVSIGGLTYDLFVNITHEIVEEPGQRAALRLPLGEKIHIERVKGICGGGASNTAVGLARLGCAATCCGVVGSDQWGEELLKNLQCEHVDTRCTVIVEGEPSSFSIIIIAQNGERVILNEPGTNAHLHDVTFDRDTVAQADWVYLNRLHPDSCEIEDDIIAILRQLHSPHLTWNPGGCQIEAGLRAKSNAGLAAQADLLLLNAEEALTFTGARTVDEALQRLAAAGVSIACISDGPRGALATDGRKRYHCPALPSTVIDTTGAGDAFGVGLTWALLSGRDLPTALRAGSINASSVVGVMGAQPGLLTEIDMLARLMRTDLPVTTNFLTSYGG